MMVTRMMMMMTKKCAPKWKKIVQKTGNGQFCSGNFYTEQF